MVRWFRRRQPVKWSWTRAKKETWNETRKEGINTYMDRELKKVQTEFWIASWIKLSKFEMSFCKITKKCRKWVMRSTKEIEEFMLKTAGGFENYSLQTAPKFG